MRRIQRAFPVVRYIKCQGWQAFDKAFVKHMVSDHKRDIKEYEREARKNGAAAEYANAQLPTLRNHLQTAQSLKSNAVR